MARVTALVARDRLRVLAPFQLGLGDVGLYDRMGLYALVVIGLTLLRDRGPGLARPGRLLPDRRLHLRLLTMGSTRTRGSSTRRQVSTPCSPSRLRHSSPPDRVVIGFPLMRFRGHYLAFATLTFALIAWSLLYAQDGITGVQYGSPSRSGSSSPAPRSRRHARPLVFGLVGLTLLLSRTSCRPASSAFCRRSRRTCLPPPPPVSTSPSTSCSCSSSPRPWPASRQDLHLLRAVPGA